MKKLHIYLLSVWALSILIASCSSNLGVTIRSTNDLNNGGNPVVVRIYQLSSAGEFQRATLDSFWGNDRQVLGSDLVADPVEIVLHPGESISLSDIELNEETRFLGVAADFYQPEGEQWKSVLDIASLSGNQVYLAVGNDRLLVDYSE